MRPLFILRAARRRAFPMRTFVVSMLFHYDSKHIRAHGCYAPPPYPYTSICAGCRHGHDFTKLYFFEVVKDMYEIHPEFPLKTYFDDVTMRGVASDKKELVEGALQAMAKLTQALQSQITWQRL